MASRTKIFFIGLLAVLIGFYPGVYLILDEKFGLLTTKSSAILSNVNWQIAFYTHILAGGVSLLIGWTQFVEQWRNTRMQWHRNIGKLYMLTVWISSISGFYVAFYATGGWASTLGFSILAVIWFVSTTMAYIKIKQKNFQAHKQWMTYSYACTFAAVTLRIWLPLLILSMGDFISAYRIVAWLSWVPNIALVFLLLHKEKNKGTKTIV